MTVFHEFAHAIHDFNSKLNIQWDIANELERLRSNPSIIKDRYDRFMVEYQKIIENVNSKSAGKIDEVINGQIESYTKKQSNLLDTLNVSDEHKQQILALSNYEELFFAKSREIMLNEYRCKYLRLNHPEIAAISDIFDSIYLGVPYSFSGVFGHGIDYYISAYSNAISEIVANFMSIKCLPDSEERLEVMRFLLGDDLYNAIEKGSYEVLGISDSKKAKEM